MRKSLLATIAGAALIAGGGLAAAQQRMEGSPGGAVGAQGSSQREPGGGVHERQSGAMQGQTQKRSGTVEEKEHRSGQSGAMQTPAQGRSGTVEEKEHRSGQSGAMQRPERSSTERSRDGVTEQRSVGSATLSPDQKTKLRGIITGGNVRRIDDVNFSLSVGTRVPDTVTFYDVPETIVEVVPEYRGFRYIVVGDELVIIDPETLEIVAVLPV